MFNKNIDLFDEPEQICNKITGGKSRSFSEMTLFEQAFLCGLLKEKKPEKILEVGVSGGGTTAVILTCLKLLESRAKMYSVDLAEKWYRTGKRETGFIAKEFENQLIDAVSHKFLLGKSLPFVIDEIGNSIDFLILDTTHNLPGELLDFLVCLPYLKDGCIVMLHDVMEDHRTCSDNKIATKLLFDLVQADKWYMEEKNTDMFGFSNIAAFEINQRTRENINSVFSGLAFSWNYMLTEWEIEKYLAIIEKNYQMEYKKWLEKIIELQKYTQIRKQINGHYRMDHEFLRSKWAKQKNVLLYGGGYWAVVYTAYARINHLPVCGWVISDDQDMITASEENLPVYRLKDVPYEPDQCSFVLALDTKHFAQVRRSLIVKGYYMIL